MSTQSPNIGQQNFLEKRQLQEIFGPLVFSKIHTLWDTDYDPKIFSDLVSSLLKYSNKSRILELNIFVNANLYFRRSVNQRTQENCFMKKGDG
jgi:hypothetical protein